MENVTVDAEEDAQTVLLAFSGMRVVFWLFTQPVNNFWLQSTNVGSFGNAFFNVGSETSRVSGDDSDGWKKDAGRWNTLTSFRTILAATSFLLLVVAAVIQGY